MEKVLHPTHLTQTIVSEISSVWWISSSYFETQPLVVMWAQLTPYHARFVNQRDFQQVRSDLEVELFPFITNENGVRWKRRRDRCSLQGLKSPSCSDTPFTHHGPLILSPAHHLILPSHPFLISPSHPFISPSHRLTLSPHLLTPHLTLSSHPLVISPSHHLTLSSHPPTLPSSHPLIPSPSHHLLLLSFSHLTLSSPHPLLSLLTSHPQIDFSAANYTETKRKVTDFLERIRFWLLFFWMSRRNICSRCVKSSMNSCCDSTKTKPRSQLESHTIHLPSNHGSQSQSCWMEPAHTGQSDKVFWWF